MLSHCDGLLLIKNLAYNFGLLMDASLVFWKGKECNRPKIFPQVNFIVRQLKGVTFFQICIIFAKSFRMSKFRRSKSAKVVDSKK